MDDNNNYDNYYEPQRSTFITVIGVIFIILAVLSLLFISVQLAMPSKFHSPERSQTIQEQIENGNLPSYVGFMDKHWEIFVPFSFVISMTLLISSIGLLMRKNWARIVFIILMSYNIATGILGLGSQLFLKPSLPASMPQSAAPVATTVMMIVRIFSFLFGIGFCILYGWIISKLLSERIRSEFLHQAQPEEIYDNSNPPHQE